MSSIVERYDRDAAEYQRHWAPVLDATALRLLDRAARLVVPAPATPRILDVGTGSGVLAIAAVRRWPRARVIGADASAGMLEVARRGAFEAGIASDDPRLSWFHAPAQSLPIEDGGIDLVVSSFVYQLVPDRAAALQEALRVLRPGGHLALVTWLDSGEEFLPAVCFDEAVYDLEIEEPEDEPEEIRAGDFRSPRTAANELRRAGFTRVSPRAETLEHAWTREGYLTFKQRYDEVALFDLLDRRTARRLLDRARERFAELPETAFIWRADVVSIVAQRPG
jgi:ubiquinone/menaquinone biosynthesis C-methylase UbiE